MPRDTGFRPLLSALVLKLPKWMSPIFAPINQTALENAVLSATVLHLLDFLPFYAQRIAYVMFLTIAMRCVSADIVNVRWLAWIVPVFITGIPFATFVFGNSLMYCRCVGGRRDRLSQSVNLRAFWFVAHTLAAARIYLYSDIWTTIKSNFSAFFTLNAISITSEILQGSRIIATPNSFVPESYFGIYVAVVIYVLRLLLPDRWQWLAYAGMTMTSSTETIPFLGWMLATLTVYMYEVRPDAAYCFLILRVQWIRPLAGQRRGLVRPTDILDRQRTGSLWLVGSLLVLETLTRLAGDLLPPIRTGFVVWSGFVAVAGSYLGNRFAKMSCPTFKSRRKTPFKYKTLESPSQFRVLRIKPQFWDRDSTVECEFEYYDAKAKFLPPYQAISHRWRDDDRRACICLDGHEFQVPIKIATILKDKRRFWRDQNLWIDTVCINQNDESERDKQVLIMKDIYERALKVVGWLECSEKKTHILRLLFQSQRSGLLQGYPSDDVVASFFDFAENDDYRRAAHSLLTDPWFERIWIVQEAAVASILFLKIGSCEIQWHVIARCMALMQQSNILESFRFSNKNGKFETVNVSAALNAQIMESLRVWYKSGKLLSVSDMAKLCLLFKSTKAEDKIIGILGLVNKRPSLRVVDSKLSREARTYTRVARDMVEEGSTLEMLRYAGIGQNRNVKDIPSWVPDWSAGLSTCIFAHPDPKHNYQAGIGTFAMDTCLAMSLQLTFTGIMAGSITYIVDLPSFDFRPPIPCDEILRWVQSSGYPTINEARVRVRDLLFTYPNSQPVEDVFWRTLLGDMDPLQRPADSDPIQVLQEHASDEVYTHKRKDLSTLTDSNDEKAIRFIINMATSHNDDIKFSHLVACGIPELRKTNRQSFCNVLKIDNMYPKTLVDFTINRKLAITDNGYLALVPKYTNVGDVVAIPFGATTPFVVRGRQDDDYEQKSQLVGECYVHGMMDGEMMPKERTPKSREKIRKWILR